MPTLPLFQTPPTPDGWHQVRAPGGYEGWFFDAEDFTAGIRLVGFIGQGWRFDGAYRDQYERYKSNPTKNPPPVPLEYPGFELIIFKAGELWAASQSSQIGPLVASSDRVDINLADNRLSADADAFWLKLSGTSSMHKVERRVIRAELLFRPEGSGFPNRFPITPEILAGRHTWTAVPLSQVTGTLTAGNEQSSFKGAGSLEHRFGTAPIELDIKRGISGRVLTKDRALHFHALQPRNRQIQQQSRAIEFTPSQQTVLTESPKVTWSMMQRYPRELTLGNHLGISNPRRPDPTKIICYDLHGPNATKVICEQLV